MKDMTTNELVDTILRLRWRAHICREKARCFTAPMTRQTMFNTAKTFDEIADTYERITK